MASQKTLSSSYQCSAINPNEEEYMKAIRNTLCEQRLPNLIPNAEFDRLCRETELETTMSSACENKRNQGLHLLSSNRTLDASTLQAELDCKCIDQTAETLGSLCNSKDEVLRNGYEDNLSNLTQATPLLHHTPCLRECSIVPQRLKSEKREVSISEVVKKEEDFDDSYPMEPAMSLISVAKDETEASLWTHTNREQTQRDKSTRLDHPSACRQLASSLRVHYRGFETAQDIITHLRSFTLDTFTNRLRSMKYDPCAIWQIEIEQQSYLEATNPSIDKLTHAVAECLQLGLALSERDHLVAENIVMNLFFEAAQHLKYFLLVNPGNIFWLLKHLQLLSHGLFESNKHIPRGVYDQDVLKANCILEAMRWQLQMVSDWTHIFRGKFSKVY